MTVSNVMKEQPDHVQEDSSSHNKPDGWSLVAILGFALAVVSVCAAVLSGLGYQLGWWHFRTGFVILKWAAYGGIVSAAVSIIGCMLTRPGTLRRGLTLSIIGLIAGLLVIGIPGVYWLRAQQVPPIHDITTDTDNPPAFVAILLLRKDAPNPAEYGGPEIASKQHEAYPDLAPLLLSLPSDKAFERALTEARKLDWQIVDAKQAEGRIEATDTTFWFGFKDDIVIRITSANGGSRIDIRSVSRVGRSDVGTNAKRIRAFLRNLT